MPFLPPNQQRQSTEGIVQYNTATYTTWPKANGCQSNISLDAYNYELPEVVISEESGAKFLCRTLSNAQSARKTNLSMM